MAKQSEKNKYFSSYGAEWISAPQYIAEIACAKIAKNKKLSLPKFFWREKELKKLYLHQLNLSYQLLQIYSEQAIILSLNDKRSDRILSLGSYFILDSLFDEYEAKQKDLQNKKINVVVDNSVPAKPTNNLRNKI